MVVCGLLEQQRSMHAATSHFLVVTVYAHQAIGVEQVFVLVAETK
jgi:hypothetical protein